MTDATHSLIRRPWRSRTYPELRRCALKLELNVGGAQLLRAWTDPESYLNDPELDRFAWLVRRGPLRNEGRDPIRLEARWSPPAESSSERTERLLRAGIHLQRREGLIWSQTDVWAEFKPIDEDWRRSRATPHSWAQAYAALQEMSARALNFGAAHELGVATLTLRCSPRDVAGWRLQLKRDAIPISHRIVAGRLVAQADSAQQVVIGIRSTWPLTARHTAGDQDLGSGSQSPDGTPPQAWSFWAD